MQRCRVVFEAFVGLLQWVGREGMGMFRYTAPSQAMGAYRHRFMEHQIYFHDNPDIRKLERSSYFGGRTEVFKLGIINERVYQLDVNSLFPSVMRDGRFPCALHRSEWNYDWQELMPDIEWDSSIAEVRLKTDKPVFPHRRNGLITYPIGEFYTTLAGAELAYAQTNGLIVAIRSWAEYRTERLFRLWVDELWAKRQEYKADGNLLYSEFAKRLMNSLYGKFAQMSPQWINDNANQSALPWSSWTEIDKQTGERECFRSFGWQIQRQCGRTERSNTFVAISSFVTAAARRRMEALRSIAGRHTVYYQGIDSVIVNIEGYTNLCLAGEVEEGKLGALRLQLAVDSGQILGCSDYRLGDKVVIAGRGNWQEDLNAADNLQRKYYASNRLFNGQPIADIREEIQSWDRSAHYRKGTVTDNGWIDPLVLSESDYPLMGESRATADAVSAVKLTASR